MVILGAAVPDFAVRVHHRGQVDFGFSWQLPFFFGARRRHGMHLGVAYYLGDDYTLLRAGYLLRVLPWDPDPFRERKLPLELHVEAGLFAGFRGAFGPRAALRLHVGGPHLGAFVSAGYEHDVVAPADRRSWGAAEIQIGFECSI